MAPEAGRSATATLFDAVASADAPAPIEPGVAHIRAGTQPDQPRRDAVGHASPPVSPPRLCVLASGSSGNCTVIRVGQGATRRTILIDAGLGTRTTPRLLASLGVRLHEVTDVLLTHLDADHWREPWMRQRDFRAVIHLHERHWPAAESLRQHRQRVRVFSGPFKPVDDLHVDPLIQHHDEHGVAAFRLRCPGGDIGFATDLGRVTPELIEHFRGVDLLAIESNYCPKMQAESDRPHFLKQRIMGGSGHLSNQQCAQATAAIGPRHVVLLHLSRQCNTPERAAAEHAERGYGLTISSQFEPTGWVGAASSPACAPTPACGGGVSEALRG